MQARALWPRPETFCISPSVWNMLLISLVGGTVWVRLINFIFYTSWQVVLYCKTPSSTYQWNVDPMIWRVLSRVILYYIILLLRLRGAIFQPIQIHIMMPSILITVIAKADNPCRYFQPKKVVVSVAQSVTFLTLNTKVPGSIPVVWFLEVFYVKIIGV